MKSFYHLVFLVLLGGLLFPAHAQNIAYIGKIKEVADHYKKGADAARKNKAGAELQLKHVLPGNKSLVLKIKSNKQKGSSENFFGEVDNANNSSFYLEINEKKASGSIVMVEQKKFYRYSSTADGSVFLTEEDIDKVLCIGYQDKKGATPEKEEKATLLTTSPTAAVAAVPALESLPGAGAVLYLDFDGQTVTNTQWNSSFNSGNPIVAAPSTLTEPEMVEAWKVMSEDFRPFVVNVTTSEAVFNNAPLNQRMRVIFTPTNYFYTGAGGVAYIGSFTWGASSYYGETPCWVWNTGAKAAGETGSHEAGHTLQLGHDGRTSPAETYFYGQANWAPIMGAGFSPLQVQWSKGEYPNANNMEDDLNKIGTLNGFGFRTDDHANDIASATPLQKDASGKVLATANKGVISSRTDVDVFSFTHEGGLVALSVNPDLAYPNLDVLLTLRNAAGAVVTTVDAPTMAATLETALEAGTYYLTIDGTTGAMGANSDYGSLGAYSVSTKDYPIPVYIDGCSTYTTLINNFSLHTLVNNSSGCSQSTARGYTNFVPVNTRTTTVYKGQSYTISMQAGSLYAQYFGVWIDYNNDKDFDDAGEFIYASPSTSVNPFATTVTIPATAPAGSTRLRVRSNWSSALSLGQSSSAMTWGETEDYTITIAEPNTAPTVSLTAPANEASFIAPATMSIRAAATDADGTVANVEFFSGATKLGEDATAPYEYSWTGVGAGSYILTAKATDNLGASTTSEAVSITVNTNSAPAVSLTAPVAGTTFTSPATIGLAATATDTDGSIAKVEFFDGATKLGEDLTSPYEYNWVGVVAGTYLLAARATDNLGASTISEAVSITVTDNSVAQGCGTGYWKNHTDRWSHYLTTTTYGSIFQNAPIDLKNKTLLEVLGLGGGGVYSLARQSVAALLNISSSSVAYAADYPTISSLRTAVNTAFVSKKAAGSLAAILENLNNAGCPLGGSSATTAHKSSDSRSGYSAPEADKLLSIYPNPSTDGTFIEFALTKAQHYSVQVFDDKGRVVARIASGVAEAGRHYNFQMAGRDLPAGVYMVQLTTDSFTQMRRLIMSK